MVRLKGLSLGCVVAGLLLGGAITQAADGAKPLDAAGIAVRVVGHTIVYQDDASDRVEAYLADDGTIRGHSRSHGNFDGNWLIRFGHYLCLTSQDPTQGGCVQVILRQQSKVEFLLDVGETEGPFALLPGSSTQP